MIPTKAKLHELQTVHKVELCVVPQITVLNANLMKTNKNKC